MGEHLQRADLAELGDERLRVPICKVVLPGIARETLEREHSDGSNFTRSRTEYALPQDDRQRQSRRDQQHHRRSHPFHSCVAERRLGCRDCVEAGAASVPPDIKLGLVGVNGGLLLVRQTMDG